MLEKIIYSKGSVTTDCLTKSSNPDDCMGVLYWELKMLFIRGMTWLLLAMSLTGIRMDRCGRSWHLRLFYRTPVGILSFADTCTVDRF